MGAIIDTGGTGNTTVMTMIRSTATHSWHREDSLSKQTTPFPAEMARKGVLFL
jgi:hypothetical protein